MILTRLLPIAAIVALISLLATGNAVLARPFMLLSVMLAPALLPRRILYPTPDNPPADSAEGEDGGGRGPRPEPPKPPDAPRGGLPLSDAAPARVRRRDHDRPTLTPSRQRRPAREPERTPQREPASRSVPR
jgi:hypothetical protein